MKPRADRERGASLLSVLVIVMLMSAAAVAATDALARSVAIAKSSGARAETFWTARGAAEAGASYLLKAMKLTEGHLTDKSDIFTQPAILPAGHGLVSIRVREGSNCFNLNALFDDIGDAAVSDGQLEAYRNLLVAAGLNRNEAQSLADTLADWVDSDLSSRTYGAEDGHYASQAEPYRTPNTRLRDISELKAVEGYDADVLARIGGLVCLRPGIDQAKLNINTLEPDQAPLLVSLFSAELSAEDAQTLIEKRPAGGWLNIEDFVQEAAVSKIAPGARHDEAVSVASTYLTADVDIGTGDLATSYRVLYGQGGTGGVSLVSMVRRDF